MSRHSYVRSAIDYADPRIVGPRVTTEADGHRLQELRTGIRICRLLAEAWMTLDELARELGMHARNVRRYIYALQAVGVDIVERRPGSEAVNVYRLEPRSWHGLLYVPKD